MVDPIQSKKVGLGLSGFGVRVRVRVKVRVRIRALGFYGEGLDFGVRCVGFTVKVWGFLRVLRLGLELCFVIGLGLGLGLGFG